MFSVNMTHSHFLSQFKGPRTTEKVHVYYLNIFLQLFLKRKNLKIIQNENSRILKKVSAGRWSIPYQNADSCEIPDF